MKLIMKMTFLFLLSQSIFAQIEVEDLNWLSGSWRGEKWGGTVEEFWSAPSGGSIIGMFRFIKEDKLQFTEHFIIAREDDKIVLKLRHFNSDFSAWEEKDRYLRFPLVESAENYAEFEGITYKKVDSTHLNVILQIEEKGKIKTEEFIFKKF